MKIVLKKDKKKKQVTNAIFIIVFIMIAIIALRPKVEVVPKKAEQIIYKAGDLTREKSLVKVNYLHAEIENLKWINTEQVVFSTTHQSYGRGSYMVDISQLSIQPYDDNTNENKTSYLERTKEYDLVFDPSDENYGLYLINTEGIGSKISENMALSKSNSPYYLISENAEKILYLEAKTYRLVSYNVKNEKKKLLNVYADENTLENWPGTITLSPQGGYVSLFDSDGLVYVYGADSGKLFARGLDAINPQFSSDDMYFFYFYKGSMTSTETATQLGILNLENNDITYETAEGEEVYWVNSINYYAEDHSLAYFTVFPSDPTYIVSALERLNLNLNEKQNSTLMQGRNIGEKSHLYYFSNSIALFSNENQVIIEDMDTKSVKNLTDLNTFYYNESESDELVSALKLSDGLIVTYGQNIYKVDAQNQILLLPFEGSLKSITTSPNYEIIGVTSVVDSEQYNLVFSLKLGEKN